MMKNLWQAILGGFMVLAVVAAQAAAPDVELHDFDAQARNANEFIGKGKWVIAVFWAHDCGICAREIHHMSEFHRAHQDKDAIVLGISVDGLERKELAHRFVARHQLPFTNLLLEPDLETFKKFGGGTFIGTPTHLFYDPSGRIVGRKIGPLSGEDVEAFIRAFNESAYAKPAPAQ